VSTAEQLGQLIPFCQTVSRFDAATQGFITHAVGTPINNFEVVTGQAYQITVSRDTTWSITGTIPQGVSFDLTTTPDTDYNWITIPWTAQCHTVAELAQLIPNCLSLSKYEASTQSYITHPVGTSINNYLIFPGNAYQVTVASQTTWP
jgi:hypothetical protein